MIFIIYFFLNRPPPKQCTGIDIDVQLVFVDFGYPAPKTEKSNMEIKYTLMHISPNISPKYISHD